jgi:hypothetical protein
MNRTVLGYLKGSKMSRSKKNTRSGSIRISYGIVLYQEKWGDVLKKEQYQKQRSRMEQEQEQKQFKPKQKQWKQKQE